MNIFDCCSKNSRLFNRFSHIYVEEDVVEHPITIEILKKLYNAKVIQIEDYKDVFNRVSQNFEAQKRSQKLILAKKKADFVYKGSRMCEDFGNENFYYASNILNCIYDCDYCYLQGMYTSANIVIFVNIEDFFNEVSVITKNQQVYLSISYDSDLLAFERLTGFVHKWIDYARSNNNVLIEVKTKSGCYSAISDIDVPDNVILAWTLSPDEIISRYEGLTPALDVRLKNIQRAVSKGLRVRMSFEPIMMIDQFEAIYARFFKKVFDVVPLEGIRDVNAGVFRMSDTQAKRFNKARKYKVFCYPMIKVDGTVTYKDYDYMKDFIYNELIKYINAEKVFMY